MCNNNSVKDCRDLLEVSQQNVSEYIFYDEAIKSKNRNRVGTERLHGRVREAAPTGFPLIEICDKLLFAIVSITHSLSTTHSLVFPFLGLTVLNLLFHRLHHFNGSGPRVVTLL